MFNIRKKIITLVSQDRLEDALNELDDYSAKISLLHKDQIAVLKGSFRDIKTKSSLRVISTEEEYMFLNRIRLSILQILDSVDRLKVENINEDISVNNIRQFRDEVYVKRNPYYTYNTLIKFVNGISFVLGKIGFMLPIVVLIIPGYFLYKNFVVKKLTTSRIEALLDRNELHKAQSLVDSLVMIDAYFDRSDFQYKILDKRIEQEIENKNIENAKTILLSSNKYFLLNKEKVYVGNFREYNENVYWFNGNLLRIAISICSIKDKASAIDLIEKEAKPTLIYIEDKIETNLDKIKEMLETLNKC